MNYGPCSPVGLEPFDPGHSHKFRPIKHHWIWFYWRGWSCQICKAILFSSLLRFEPIHHCLQLEERSFHWLLTFKLSKVSRSSGTSGFHRKTTEPYGTHQDRKERYSMCSEVTIRKEIVFYITTTTVFRCLRWLKMVWLTGSLALTAEPTEQHKSEMEKKKVQADLQTLSV